MPRKFYQLRCVSCDHISPETESVARCSKCGEALQVEIAIAELKKRVRKMYRAAAPLSAKKYLAFYPLDHPERAVSLGEGGTPLLPLAKIGRRLKQPNLFVKNEAQNPTGVFKDRGSLVEISKAVELGAKAVVVASTGNMAASVSAYAAVAGLPCYVLIPENTPLGKLAQVLGYGARVLAIRGSYADCCRLAESLAAKRNFYLAGDYAFRSEGQKSLAFEVVEQLDGRAPDVVVVPVGCGTNLAAIWQGFVEFKKLGFIRRLPKMVAVQPRGCSTIVAAFQKKLAQAVFVKHPRTTCSAVGIGRPLDDLKALAAIRDSGGTAIDVPDDATAAAQRELGASEAIFVEPSAALPLAAVPILRRRKFLRSRDTVVLVASGAGLKDPRSTLNAHPAPPSVEPRESEIDRFFRYRLYAIRSAGFAERSKVLFKKLPTLPRLCTTIKKEFNASVKDSHAREMLAAIKSFLAKGKPVAKSDLQSLLEDALTDLTYERRVMRVLDYQLDIRQKTPPRARVMIEFLGRKKQATATGVGPVDAVIAAIRKALTGQSQLGERLIDFGVRVDANGTNATTEVSMRLVDKKKNEVTATASSPDIIAASIAAFEKGYNILYWKEQTAAHAPRSD